MCEYVFMRVYVCACVYLRVDGAHGHTAAPDAAATMGLEITSQDTDQIKDVMITIVPSDTATRRYPNACVCVSFTFGGVGLPLPAGGLSLARSLSVPFSR